MAALRHLFYQHYQTAGPKATMWDEWLPSPSLWPAYQQPGQTPMRDQWRAVLNKRHMDTEGYVATHQHASIAHQTGWPFPFWTQGRNGFGYHFSYRKTIGKNWRPEWISSVDAWKVSGAHNHGLSEDGWELRLTTASASIETPAGEKAFLPFESPFVQLRWKSEELQHAQPYLEWITSASATFTPDRRMYFDPPQPGGEYMTYTMVPLFRHPEWKGGITGLRLNFGNQEPVTSVTIQAMFAQYDTRHNINNQSYIAGCTEYFWWTRDLNFLRANINKMRTALRFTMLDGETEKEKVVLTGWVGHEGRTGLTALADGTTDSLTGEGVGNNYWDLLPFGHKDTYATLRFYSTLQRMAQLEDEIAAHPQWNIPPGVLQPDPQNLRAHAAEVKEEGNRLFWNEETGRFTAGVNADGIKPDYGFTFVNLEAIYYGFATDEHARTILDWITGKRVVAGDTAQGDDIYTWRFAPRATTRRNVEYYGWYWNAPGLLKFGDQVQDGGAVLGFSYHDLMSRLKYLGADDAWQRLQEILSWYHEVQAAGGYRKYYDGTRPGTLQGGGPPGGLGMDQEFFESVLVPQVVLDGFLGFEPTGSGFRLQPKLPSTWPELTVDGIHLHNHVLVVKASSSAIEVKRAAGPTGSEPTRIELPDGKWKAEWADGTSANDAQIAPVTEGAWDITWGAGRAIRFTRE